MKTSEACYLRSDAASHLDQTQLYVLFSSFICNSISCPLRHTALSVRLFIYKLCNKIFNSGRIKFLCCELVVSTAVDDDIDVFAQ